MALTADGQDIVRTRENPTIERQHEWAHGDPKPDQSACPQQAKPIFTKPERFPDDCHTCGADQWFSKGYVHRDRKNNVIVRREESK